MGGETLSPPEVSTLPAEAVDPLVEDVEDSDGIEVSMNAIGGSLRINTIKLIGHLKGRSVLVLLDSGSTHSFINATTAKELKLETVLTTPVNVAVADGRNMAVSLKCNGCRWEMQQHQFQFDFRVLELGAYDLILGVDWMKAYSPITFDFPRNQVTITTQGTSIKLTRMSEDAELWLISCRGINRLLRCPGSSVTLGLYTINGGPTTMLSAVSSSGDSPFADQLAQLLYCFRHIFDEPTDLPPFREFNHSIPLKPGVEPINIRPYRYPYFQKAEVEKLTEKMLSAGIIQPSHNPYALPVLLVKKKD